MAISWFWFLGASYLTQFPNFSISNLNGDPSLVTLLLSLFTLGIGLGSLVCEKLTQSRIDLGIVPIGALGLSIFGIDLFLSVDAKPDHLVSWLQFLGDSSQWRLLVDLFGIGFFGGVFIVPLYAFVQTRTAAHYRARTIAVVNIMNALFMVVSAISGIIFLSLLELTIPQFFLVLAIMNLVVCGYIFYQVDEFAIRFVVWVLSHTMYRVTHDRIEHIPTEGPAVLVCNHVSYADALLIAGASPRPIRFVMDHQIFANPWLGGFFRLVRAIPIAPEYKDKAIYLSAFEQVSQALDDGELVCIFPEGKLTKTGELNAFRGGIEKIIQRNAVPVVPMALKGLWGSVFSHKDGAALTKLPKRFWSKVRISADTPWVPEKVDADQLQEHIQAMLDQK